MLPSPSHRPETRGGPDLRAQYGPLLRARGAAPAPVLRPGRAELSDLKRWDRWVGARLALGAKEVFARLVGFEHTWLKVLAIIGAVLLAFVLFGRVPYRVKAPVTLRTDDVAVLSAPLDGHIEKVDVRIGDTVQEGQELLALDQTDLLLSEAQIVAEGSPTRRSLPRRGRTFPWLTCG